MATLKDSRRSRIKKSIRGKIAGTAERPRLTVYRSNSAVYAQIIDDAQGNILGALPTLDKPNSKRPPLNKPALQDDSAAVMTTKLITPAASRKPILSNIATNGLPC